MIAYSLLVIFMLVLFLAFVLAIPIGVPDHPVFLLVCTVLCYLSLIGGIVCCVITSPDERECEYEKQAYRLELRETHLFGKVDTTYVLMPNEDGQAAIDFPANDYKMVIKETRHHGKTDTSYAFRKITEKK